MIDITVFGVVLMSRINLMEGGTGRFRPLSMFLAGILFLSCAPGETKAGLGPNEPSAIVSLAVSPSPASVHTDGVLPFSVSATHQDGSSSVPQVAWTATGGIISTAGVYTPGQTLGDFTVTASLQDGSVAGSSTVTILAVTSPVVSISVSPSSVSLSTGASRNFSVTATRQDGSTFTPSVTWTATGGTISTSGRYTAGNTDGNFLVIATLQGGTLSDTSTVAVSAPVLQAVILSPSNASIVTGGSRQFTVSGQWSDGATIGPSVNYSATGGTITSGGLYTAGSTTGTFRVIAVQQGGTLADTAVVTLTQAPPSNRYFNSSEVGGDGSNPNYLTTDDFEDGDWYTKDCDQANNSGGLLQTDGWCGTIYANPITPTGAAVCGGAGFGGSNCAATSGYHNGSIGGRNMASHGFAGGVTNVQDAYYRLYFQPQSDYTGGHEKMFDFTFSEEPGAAGIVALCYNYFGTQTIGCIPYLHQDDGVQGQSNGWMRSNVGSTVTLARTHWYYFEMHVKLNTPGQYDGVFEWWLNDCGVNGTGCTGTPTLRGRYTTVKYRDSGSEASVAMGGIWIENWANEATTGTMNYDNVIASRAPIGYAH